MRSAMISVPLPGAPVAMRRPLRSCIFSTPVPSTVTHWLLFA